MTKVMRLFPESRRASFCAEGWALTANLSLANAWRLGVLLIIDRQSKQAARWSGA
jgi:hypothetical protein